MNNTGFKIFTRKTRLSHGTYYDHDIEACDISCAFRQAIEIYKYLKFEIDQYCTFLVIENNYTKDNKIGWDLSGDVCG